MDLKNTFVVWVTILIAVFLDDMQIQFVFLFTVNFTYWIMYVFALVLCVDSEIVRRRILVARDDVMTISVTYQTNWSNSCFSVNILTEMAGKLILSII